MDTTTTGAIHSDFRAIATADAPAQEAFDHLFSLGEDRHEVPVVMERIVENLMDWEHFPYIHPENFASTELLEDGPGWYRVRLRLTGTDKLAQILVVLYAARHDHGRWSIIVEEGPQAGHHTYTVASECGEGSIATHVTFYAPTPPRNEVVRKAMLRVFRQQYDLFYAQDTVMMTERQRALKRVAAQTHEPAPGVPLGTVEEVVQRAPFGVLVGGHRFWIRHHEGVLESLPADCPHLLGPLPCPGPDDGSTVVCPWHGYTFDVHEGRSNDGRALRLRAPPQVIVADGLVRLQRG